jgi:hypothetical protein
MNQNIPTRAARLVCQQSSLQDAGPFLDWVMALPPELERRFLDELEAIEIDQPQCPRIVDVSYQSGTLFIFLSWSCSKVGCLSNVSGSPSLVQARRV